MSDKKPINAQSFAEMVIALGEKLSPESVQYWSRNNDELEKLLAIKKETSSHHEKIDPVLLKFYEKMLRLVDRDKIPFWLNHQDQLGKLLELGNFEKFTQIVHDPYVIPALPETDKVTLWKKRVVTTAQYLDYFREDNHEDVFVKRLQPSVPKAQVFAYQSNVQLFEDELLEEMGATEADLARMAFSYSQIAWMINDHKGSHLRKPAVLNYDTVNYLPLLKPDGSVVFIATRSAKDSFRKKHKKWDGWFKTDLNKYYWKGRFLMKDTSIIIE